MSFQPFLGFAPDLDYDTPGAFSDCQHMVPTPRGMAVQPGWANSEANATLPGGIVMGFGFGSYNGNRVQFCATVGSSENKIYRSFGSFAWLDVSRPAGYGGVADEWVFVPFGGFIIAAGGTPTNGPTIQAANMLSSAFADVPGGPRAGIVVAASRFVLAFGDQDYSDRWRCCARDDHTSWTAALSTLAATGRIVEPAGDITAAVEMHDDVVAFKHQSMHLGRFTGAPEVWTWTKLPYNVGCGSKRAVCKTKNGIAFAAADGVYLYDGASLTPLLEGKAREWWIANADIRRYITVDFDAAANQLWVVYGGIGQPNTPLPVLVIDLGSGRMGRARYGADLLCAGPGPRVGDPLRMCGFMRYNASTTIRHFARLDTTREAGISWFDNADFTFARDSAEEAPYFVMPELGDGMSEVEMTELRLKWREAPDDATAVHYTRPYAGGPLTVVGERPLSDTKSFQTRANARYHRVKVRLQDDVEMTGYAYEPTPTGRKGAR